MFRGDKKAVSQVVSVLLVLTIVVGAMSSIMLWGIPFLDDKKMRSQVQTSVNSFNIVDSTMGNAIIEGPGGKSVCSVSSNEDRMSTSIVEGTDTFIASYSYKKGYDFTVSGLESATDSGTFDINVKEYDDPWVNNFRYRRKIAVNHSLYPDPDVIINPGFPVFVECYGVEIDSQDQNEIAFYDTNGGPLYFEIEKYDQDEGYVAAWVKLNTIDDTADNTEFYMYYDGDSGSLSDIDWGPTGYGYSAVWHLNEKSGDHIDSVNDLHATPADFDVGNQGNEYGYMDGADLFNGINDKVRCGDHDSLDLDGSFTIEAIIRLDSDKDEGVIVSKDNEYCFYVKNSLLYFKCGSGECYNDKTIYPNRWYYVAVTYDGSATAAEVDNLRFYVPSYTDDPVTKKTLSGPPSSGTGGFYIGYPGSGFSIIGAFAGHIDEVRISKVFRDENYFKNNFANLNYKTKILHIEKKKDDSSGLPYFDETKVDIYKLGTDTEDDYSSLLYYEKIYDDEGSPIMASQSFSTYADFILDKLYLKIDYYGSISSDLKVDLYRADGDRLPDRDSEIINLGSISKEDIDNSPFEDDWVELNVDPDMRLDPNLIYDIVLSTDGGSYNAYYIWYYNTLEQFYEESEDLLFLSGIYEKGWKSSGFPGDFNFRLGANPHPVSFNEEDIEIYPYMYYTNIEYEFKFSAEASPEGNPVYYYIDWGDGTNVTWGRDLSSNNYYIIRHKWNKPGFYKIKVSVKEDLNNVICTQDYVINKWVLEGYILTDDNKITRDLSLDLTDGKYTVNLNEDDDISGNILIDLYEPGGLFPVSRIWVFPMNSIIQEASYSNGNQQIIYQNGAVLTNGPVGSNVKNEPAFYSSDNAVALRVIQIESGTTTSMSGAGRHNIKIENKKNINRDKPTDYLDWELFDDYVHNLKFQFHGSNKDTWMNFYKRMDSFSDDELDPSGKTIRFTDDGKKLVLDQSILIVDIGVGG